MRIRLRWRGSTLTGTQQAERDCHTAADDEDAVGRAARPSHARPGHGQHRRPAHPGGGPRPLGVETTGATGTV
jgi:hypothetical protein